MITPRMLDTIGRGAILAVGLVLVTGAAAEGQRTITGFPRSDQSDVTGPAVTSGDQLAPLFAEPGTAQSMQCSVAWGVRNAASQAQLLLTAANLSSTLNDSDDRIDPRAQHRVLALLTASPNDRQAGVPVSEALSANNGTAARQAERLVAQLHGLLRELDTMDPVRPGDRVPSRFARATGAYNGFIDASSPEFISNPPDELLAIHAVMESIIAASIENAGRQGDVNVVDSRGLACAVVASALPPPAPPAPRPFEMCALVNGDFRYIAGLYRPEQGDSIVLVDDRPVPLTTVYPSATLAETAPWVTRGEMVRIGETNYQPFGITRVVRPGDVFRRGYVGEFEYFAAAGEAEDASVIYFLAGPECLVQPYRSVETIRVRG